MDVDGCIWMSMNVHGCAWMCMDVDGCVWMRMNPRSMAWLCTQYGDSVASSWKKREKFAKIIRIASKQRLVWPGCAPVWGFGASMAEFNVRGGWWSPPRSPTRGVPPPWTPQSMTLFNVRWGASPPFPPPINKKRGKEGGGRGVNMTRGWGGVKLTGGGTSN